MMVMRQQSGDGADVGRSSKKRWKMELNAIEINE